VKLDAVCETSVGVVLMRCCLPQAAQTTEALAGLPPRRVGNEVRCRINFPTCRSCFHSKPEMLFLS